MKSPPKTLEFNVKQVVWVTQFLNFSSTHKYQWVSETVPTGATWERIARKSLCSRYDRRGERIMCVMCLFGSTMSRQHRYPLYKARSYG